LLEELTDKQYTQTISVLSNATLGQHVRHSLEFFIELDKGYDRGVVDYDKRIRNQSLESDRNYAIAILINIKNSLAKADKAIKLRAEYGYDESNIVIVNTNYFRELLYNLEHTVHHMAIIRIGVNAISSILLPPEFGVATSTLKYRNVCAQ
jgi:hypothetical protein